MRSFLITLLVLAWVGAVGAFVYFLSGVPYAPRGPGSGGPPFFLFGGFLVAIIVTVIVPERLDRLRRKELTEGLAARGYILNTADNSPAQVLHYRPHKRHHSYKEFFSAVGLHNDRPAHIAEYTYSIGHGKHRHEARVLEVALDFVPPVPSVPLAIIPRARFFDRSIPRLFDAPATPPVDDPVFNKRWEIDTADPAAATPFLTPPRTALLKTAHRREFQWVAADGWLSCSWHKRPTIADVDALLTRVEQVANG